MKKYYINDQAQSNGDHEVHDQNCTYLPQPQTRVYLGSFTSCEPAVSLAAKIYRQVNGCNTCSPSCHNQ